MHDSGRDQPTRAQLEYMLLATLLRCPEKVPLVIGRLDPRLFDVPIIAGVVKAIAESYVACNRLSLDDLRPRLTAKEKSKVDDVMRYSTMMTENAKILAALDRLEEELASRPAPASAPPVALEATSAPETFCLPLTEFDTEPRQWLWPGRLELGQLTLIGGESGSGKSLVACDLAARTTSGLSWPDGAAALPPGSVLLVASGDDVSGDGGSFFRDTLKAIEGAIEALQDCRLVLIDPLRLSIGRTATTIGGDPRARLELLAALARRQQVAVLGVASAAYEDRRRNTLGDALKLATGASAATAWQVVRHPHHKQLRLFLPARPPARPTWRGWPSP